MAQRVAFSVTAAAAVINSALVGARGEGFPTNFGLWIVDSTLTVCEVNDRLRSVLYDSDSVLVLNVVGDTTQVGSPRMRGTGSRTTSDYGAKRARTRVNCDVRAGSPGQACRHAESFHPLRVFALRVEAQALRSDSTCTWRNFL